MGVALPDEGTARNGSTTKADLPPVPVHLDEDDAPPIAKKPQRKRKRTVLDEEEEDEEAEPKQKKKSKGKKALKKGKDKDDGEKRPGRFRAQAPQSYQALLNRAMSQRMIVFERTREETADGLVETVEIVGSTGNIYTVKIDRKPSCNCPHANKGNECKHIVYVLVRTLKAPAHLQYQRYFLSSELKEIFEKAPPIPTDKGEDEKDDNGNRKPIEDDCPICCVEFSSEDGILFCRAACGNNVHKGCFEQWATQKRAMGGGVTCPFCRTPWEGEKDKPGTVDKALGVNKEGYVNVAEQMGMNGLRDTSTYHSFWVRKQRMNGDMADEDPSKAIYYSRFRNGGW